MNLRPWIFALATGFVLVGCSPHEAVDEARPVRTTADATQIRLPDGLTCRWEPDASPDGPYDCGSRNGSEVRLAAPPLVTDTTLRATLGMRSAAGPLRRRALVAEIDEVVLAGGSVCRNARRSATPALDDRRLDFTCEAAAFDGLVGSLQAQAERFVATAVKAEKHPDGLRLVRVGPVPVAVIGLSAEGPLSESLSIRSGGALISRRF